MNYVEDILSKILVNSIKIRLTKDGYAIVPESDTQQGGEVHSGMDTERRQSHQSYFPQQEDKPTGKQ